MYGKENTIGLVGGPNSLFMIKVKRKIVDKVLEIPASVTTH